MKKKYIISLIVAFILIGVGSYCAQQSNTTIDMNALIIANIFMLLMAILAFTLVKNKIGDKPQAFVNGVFSGTFLKLFLCMMGILIYVYLNHNHLYKINVFFLMVIYVIYTFIETLFLSKMARKK